jgi:hypothetical protein
MRLENFFHLSILAIAVGCTPVEPLDIPPDAQEAQRQEVLLVPANQNPDLDLLLVIDDSPSMLDKQSALARALSMLEAQLKAIPGGMPNLHLGVVTSDMGTSGSGSLEPGTAIGGGTPGTCAGTGKSGKLQTNGAPITGMFLESRRDGVVNYSTTFIDAVSKMVSVGAAGCGFEQSLSAMRAALDSTAMNAGFLRASANLAVVTLSDEDDCSARDPSVFSSDPSTLGPLQSFRCFEYGVRCSPDAPRTTGSKSGCEARPTQLLEDVTPFKEFLIGLKGGDARKVMFSAIVGDPTKVTVETRTPPNGGADILALAHACDYPVSGGLKAVADPGVRFQSLVSAMPGRSVIASVCSDDLSPSVTAIGKSIRRLVGDTCLERPVAEPADCIVEDVYDGSEVDPVRLPVCTDGEQGNCYTLAPDASCTDGAPLRLSVRRAQPAVDGVWTRVRCVTP